MKTTRHGNNTPRPNLYSQNAIANAAVNAVICIAVATVAWSACSAGGLIMTNLFVLESANVPEVCGFSGAGFAAIVVLVVSAIKGSRLDLLVALFSTAVALLGILGVVSALQSASFF